MKKIFMIAFMLTLFFTASANAETELTTMEKLESQGIMTEVYTQDFENWEGSDGTFSPMEGSYEIADDVGRGNSFKFINYEPDLGDKEISGSLNPAFAAEVILYKQSVYFTDNSTKNKPLAIFRSTATSNNEMLTLQASKNGYFQKKPSNENLIRYDTHTWYDIIYVINFSTKKYDVYINDEHCIRNEDFPNKEFANFKTIYFMKLWDKAVEGEAYLDDIGLYSYTPYPSASLDKTDIAYDEDEITVHFSTTMDEKTLENAVRVVDTDGNSVKTGGKLSEDLTKYTITLKEVLKHSTTYTILFDESIASTAEMNITTESLEFTTDAEFVENMIFRCGSTELSTMEGTAGKTVQVLCFVKDNDKDAMLIAGLYCNNRMVNMKATSNLIKIGEQRRANVPIAVPDDGNEYVIKVYVWDNSQNQAAYIASAELK